MNIHIVKYGETAYSIANQYGVSAERLIFDNQILNPQNLVVGQSLLILFPEITHEIKEGESLFSIADYYKVSAKDIARNNPYIINQAYLEPGQIIVIKYKDQKIRDIKLNGYAYPFINRNTLKESLIYLSEFSIFSYGFTTEGELIPPDDEELLLYSSEFNVPPTLVLTPFGEDGKFNNRLVSIVCRNINVRENLIQNLLYTMNFKNYSQVDIDFEYILPEDKYLYIDFIRQLTNTMNPEGYQVSVALAPKTSSDQPGLLYEGIDYRGLGEAANKVLIMTYEWGYTYGPPMAVAPINKVKEVVEYAVSQIVPEKIDMGIPNYGYDWSLPFIKGVSAATVIGNIEAVQIAYQNNANIKFDELSMSPYFEYKKDGVSHIVWFEDARSINEKFKLIVQYNLRGAGYWNLMRYFRQNWMLLNNLYIIQ